MEADLKSPLKSPESRTAGTGKLRHTVGMTRFFERALVNTDWFVLVKDGSTQPTDVKWLQTPSFYTKLYRMKLDGEYVNTWVRFIYNLRDNWADFEMSYHDMAARASARELSSRRLVRAIEGTAEEAVAVSREVPNGKA